MISVVWAVFCTHEDLVYCELLGESICSRSYLILLNLAWPEGGNSPGGELPSRSQSGCNCLMRPDGCLLSLIGGVHNPQSSLNAKWGVHFAAGSCTIFTTSEKWPRGLASNFKESSLIYYLPQPQTAPTKFPETLFALYPASCFSSSLFTPK